MSLNNGRKRRSFTMAEKLEVIRAAEEQERTSVINKVELSTQFNMSRQNVQAILRSKNKILHAVEDGSDSKRKRLYPAKYPLIEEKLVTWARQLRSRNDPITGHLIKVRIMLTCCDL